MGGAKQVVYVITDGMPTDVSATTKAAAEVRKVARLAFIPVGDDYLVTGFGDFPGMNAWASKPTSENVFYAKDFKKLETQLQKAVVSTCKEDKPEKVICQSQGKVPMDVSIIIDGSGSVGNDGWDYSVKAAKRMAGSFGAATRVSAAVFSTGFDWLTQNPKAKKTPCPDTPGCSPDVKKNPSWCTKSGSPNYWQHNRKTCPGTCKTGAKCKVDDAFATPAEAEKAIAGAKFPKGATATAGALDRVLSLIKTRGAKGATQIVYFITDGEPNSPNQHTAVSETTKEAAKLRKAARLIFIPVGKGAPLSRMKTWASTPTSENVFYAKDFKALKHQLTKAVKSSCGKVKESKTKAAEEKKTKEEAEKISKSREKDKKKEKAAKKKEAADKAAKKEKKAKADEKASKEAKKKVAEKTKKIKEKETKKEKQAKTEKKAKEAKAKADADEAKKKEVTAKGFEKFKKDKEKKAKKVEKEREKKEQESASKKKKEKTDKKKAEEKKAKKVLKEQTEKKNEAQSKAKESQWKETKSKEKAKKAVEKREKAAGKKKAEECKPTDVKGEEFYSWSGKYCYHIVAGSVLEQGRWHGQGRKSLCNKKGFKKTVVIGRGKGISPSYKNGDNQGCPNGKARSASLRIVKSPTSKSSTAKVTEPHTCHYSIVITVPNCKPSATKK